MSEKRSYVGVPKDENGGLTPVGRIVMDAWVFGLIPETETGEGWSLARLDALYDQVTRAWEPHGHLASRLPAELRERHARIYDDAVRRARSQGWDPELHEEDD